MRTGKDLMPKNTRFTDSEFANRLNFVLLCEGMSGAKLARLTGLATGTISGYRKGTTLPNVEVAAKIARALDISLDWLCGLVNE